MHLPFTGLHGGGVKAMHSHFDHALNPISLEIRQDILGPGSPVGWGAARCVGAAWLEDVSPVASTKGVDPDCI